MATKSAKAYIYGMKEKKRKVAAKKKTQLLQIVLQRRVREELRIWIQGTKTIGGSNSYECLC